MSMHHWGVSVEEPAPPEDLDLLSNAICSLIPRIAVVRAHSKGLKNWMQKEEDIQTSFLISWFVFVPGHSFDRIFSLNKTREFAVN